MDRNLIEQNNAGFLYLMETSTGNVSFLKQIYEKFSPNINVFKFVCASGHLELAKWILSTDKNVDLSEDYHYAFHRACMNGRVEVAKWLQELNPHLYYSYNIEYWPNGKIKRMSLRSPKQIRVIKRFETLWMASDFCEDKNNLLYKIPQDVSKYIIEMYL